MAIALADRCCDVSQKAEYRAIDTALQYVYFWMLLQDLGFLQREPTLLSCDIHLREYKPKWIVSKLNPADPLTMHLPEQDFQISSSFLCARISTCFLLGNTIFDIWLQSSDVHFDVSMIFYTILDFFTILDTKFEDWPLY